MNACFALQKKNHNFISLFFWSTSYIRRYKNECRKKSSFRMHLIKCLKVFQQIIFAAVIRPLTDVCCRFSSTCCSLITSLIDQREKKFSLQLLLHSSGRKLRRGEVYYVCFKASRRIPIDSPKIIFHFFSAMNLVDL